MGARPLVILGEASTLDVRVDIDEQDLPRDVFLDKSKGTETSRQASAP